MSHERKQTMNKTKGRQHLLALWARYVEDAENADGPGYWQLFEKPVDAVEDFALWIHEGGHKVETEE